MRKIILFELNEVPFRVVDYYCQKFPDTVFAKTLSQCTQYETVTEDVGHLHPWVTWPTMHRGIPNTLHEIEDFGEELDAVDEKYPPIWKTLHKHGIHTGVYASMHSFPPPPEYEDYAFFVPDPFAKDARVHPKKVQAFQEFNLVMSRRSGRNVDTGIDLKSASKLLMTLPKIGIKSETMAAVGKQLVQERAQSWTKTRRRVFQSVLAFDVYMDLLKSKKPAFSTFLTNHVASVMHRYWAATFPGDYSKNDLPQEWLDTYSGEIDFAMKQFNSFFEKIKKFVDQNPEYVLVIASSMGQQASKAELRSTESYVKDFDKLIKFLGLEKDEWDKRPAMHPQYNLLVKPEKQEEFRANIKQLFVSGRPLQFREKEGGFFSLDFGHPNLTKAVATYKGEDYIFDDLGLTNEKIDDESSGTAYHIPEGIMLIYNPQDLTYKIHRKGKISTCDFAPSVLEHFGLEVPAYMSKNRIKELVDA